MNKVPSHADVLHSYVYVKGMIKDNTYNLEIHYNQNETSVVWCAITSHGYVWQCFKAAKLVIENEYKRRNKRLVTTSYRYVDGRGKDSKNVLLQHACMNMLTSDAVLHVHHPHFILKIDEFHIGTVLQLSSSEGSK